MNQLWCRNFKRNFCDKGLRQLCTHLFYCMNRNSQSSPEFIIRGPNLFFKYFYFLFGPGLFYPLRVITTVQFFFGTLVGPLTLLHPKMELLRCREPRELETLFFLHLTWFYVYEIRVKGFWFSRFPASQQFHFRVQKGQWSH